jgi:hypothetical protein
VKKVVVKVPNARNRYKISDNKLLIVLLLHKQRLLFDINESKTFGKTIRQILEKEMLDTKKENNSILPISKRTSVAKLD